MFCTKCGKTNTNNNKFCTQCGSKLVSEKPAHKPEQQVEKPGSKKSSTGLIIALVIIFVVLIGVGVAVYFGYGFFKNIFEESVQETRDSEDSTSNDLIEKTFITTTYENERPKDIDLGSFSADAPYLLVVAELSRAGADTDEFRVKWFYLPFSKETPFYTEALTDWQNRDWLVSSVDIGMVPANIVPYQTYSNTFPIGSYKAEWYNGNEFLTTTEFTVSGQ